MTISNAAIGSAIRALRDRVDLSVNDLAKITGLSPSTLSRTEAGARHPRVSELDSIAKAVSITLDDFLNLAKFCDLKGAQDKYDELERIERELLELRQFAILELAEKVGPPALPEATRRGS